MFIEQVAQAVDGVSLQQSGVVDGHVHRLIEGAPKQGWSSAMTMVNWLSIAHIVANRLF